VCLTGSGARSVAVVVQHAPLSETSASKYGLLRRTIVPHSENKVPNYSRWEIDYRGSRHQDQRATRYLPGFGHAVGEGLQGSGVSITGRVPL
jgi:hypothetical protein